MRVPMYAMTHPPAIHVLAILVIVWQVMDIAAMVSEDYNFPFFQKVNMATKS